MLDLFCMKKFKVFLRDGRSEFVEAETYRRDGEQYVFDKKSSSEVEFFNADDVIGIVEEQDRTSDPKTPRAPFLSEFLP
jgi:hypothetical protein